jgi:hypothetical protein
MLRAKKASTSGLGSLGSANLSSARSRFSRFWLVATTTVGNGGRLGGAGAGCFARLPSPSGFGATPRGETPVEHLQPGDIVTLARGGSAPVLWCGQRRVRCDRHPRPHDVWPVRVRAGAFAAGRPERDLLLSPDHAVFADGVLVPVRHLVNGAAIVQEPVAAITYHHVELTQHEVVLAEGLPCESYLDTGNRATFGEGDAAAVVATRFS